MPARLDREIERRLRELARTFALDDTKTLHALGRPTLNCVASCVCA
jgi:hypothetical protein